MRNLFPSPALGGRPGWGSVATTIQKARTLRSNLTNAEQFLWQRLRLRQLDGHKFRRQRPLGPYIVDFVCLEKKLIVEVDGGQHSDHKVYDDEA